MLVAASLVPEEKRAQAAARVLMGLTVATIIGVPSAGQSVPLIPLANATNPRTPTTTARTTRMARA